MKKSSNENTLSLFDEKFQLDIVNARFDSVSKASFTDLLQGYQRLRVLTYSSSVPLVKQIAMQIPDIEIVFGREDILHKFEIYVSYQDELVRGLRQEISDDDVLRERIDKGLLRLFVVADMISHEKLYLLEGNNGHRVITGSANFSENAMSGRQNESFVVFTDDNLAWEYFNNKYQMIRERATMVISKRAILDETLEPEHLPVFDPANVENTHKTILVVEQRSPEPEIIHKILHVRPLKQYDGIATVVNQDKKGIVITRETRNRAIQYVKSNSRTENINPQETLQIFTDVKRIELANKNLDLNPKAEDITRDVNLMVEYFEGFQQFRGDREKLARDYFTFMSWLYISPFICDFRNRAHAMLDDDLDKLDYPVFGLLYGKSNCGKSELVKWLLISMFGREGFLPNDWFTKGNMVELRQQNKRYPLVFDDMDKTRFANHAIPLIKEDYIAHSDYPAVVLSMNADKDTFESEVRKRCLIIYTAASLPDHTGESRKLGTKIKKNKRLLDNALYRLYLQRVLDNVGNKPPKDVLEFSSRILKQIFTEYGQNPLPLWCNITTMDRYIQTKHDKIKNELRSYLEHSIEAWTTSGPNVVLSLDDIHQIRKLQKDVPDYLISHVSGNRLVFHRKELEEFLEEPVLSKKTRPWWHFGK